MHRRNAPGARSNASVFRKLAALAATLIVASAAFQAQAEAAPRPPAPPERSPNVFGSTALPVSHTALDPYWAGVAHDNPAITGAALQLEQRVRGQPALEQLQTVNAWVNHAVAYVGDPPGRQHWATLSETLGSGKGDCKDSAIAKMALLKAAGVPVQDLYLVVVRDLVKRADHAVVAVQMDGQFWILDIATDEVLPQRAVHDYRPIVTFTADHKWIHAFSSQMNLASAGTQPAAP